MISRRRRFFAAVERVLFGENLPVGTRRTRRDGSEVVKVAEGDWRPVPKGKQRGKPEEVAERARGAHPEKGEDLEDIIPALDELEAHEGPLDSKARKHLVKGLEERGIGRMDAEALVDSLHGKPRGAARLKRYVTKTVANVKATRDKLVSGLEKEGVPRPVAMGVATFAATLASSPLSTTTIASPVLGPWALTPGLGQVEAGVVYGGTKAGARAAKTLRRVMGRKGLDKHEGS